MGCACRKLSFRVTLDGISEEFLQDAEMASVQQNPAAFRLYDIAVKYVSLMKHRLPVSGGLTSIQIGGQQRLASRRSLGIVPC